MEVIRCTPVRNEAYLSGKPLLLSSDRADQGGLGEERNSLLGAKRRRHTPDNPRRDSLLPLSIRTKMFQSPSKPPQTLL